MSNVIQIKRGASAPSNGTLQPGELGINTFSGVLYIGSKDDNGQYISTFPYAYRLRSGAGIQTTKDQEGDLNPNYGPYVDFRFLNSNGDIRGSIMITDKNGFNFNCQITGENYADRYRLPEPTTGLIKDNWYDILTSKNTVTVAQGGTGRDTLTADCALIGSDGNAVDLRAITNNATIGNCGWTGNGSDNDGNGTNLITLNTLAFWNGRYNNTSSNLAYCSKGEFGNAAVKDITTPNLNSENNYTTGPIYGGSDELLVNARTLRWWNGQHSAGTTNSNLAYCNKGAFGTFATKDAGTFLQTADDTVSQIVLKGTTVSGSNTFENTNPKICFYNDSSQQGISLTYSDYDNVQKPASLTLNGEQGGEYFIAPFVKTVLVTTSYGTSNPSGTGAAGQVYFKVV